MYALKAFWQSLLSVNRGTGEPLFPYSSIPAQADIREHVDTPPCEVVARWLDAHVCHTLVLTFLNRKLGNAIASASC